MTSVATPPIFRSQHVFGLPTRGRGRQSRAPSTSTASTVSSFGSSNADLDPRRISELRQMRAQQVEEASMARARAYINDFLQKSEWSDQLDQITVHWADIPTMEELESYGNLDATEGTRACRRLFKAVVVWDDLGHGLWQRLRVTADQKKAALKGLGPMLRMGVVGEELPPSPLEQPPMPSQSQPQPQSQPHHHHYQSSLGLGRRVSNESSASNKSRSSSRSSHSFTEARAVIPKIFRNMIWKQQ